MKKRSRHEEETNEGQRRTLSERATDWILGKQKVTVPERIRSGHLVPLAEGSRGRDFPSGPAGDLFLFGLGTALWTGQGHRAGPI
ncbi:hypothetical protein VTN49DRAFT_1770 [Thermomyces lanuginosus]|uniref:uncharacterized protein n=1 Tax=Thermomyces lanuginosus TaxID=5541 RepID=UPI0037446F07